MKTKTMDLNQSLEEVNYFLRECISNLNDAEKELISANGCEELELLKDICGKALCSVQRALTNLE